MAFRYRVEYSESGDVIDPIAWNRNMSEMAEEWNGGLDRDNFPMNFVSQSMLLKDQCTIIKSDSYTESEEYLVDMDTSSWNHTSALVVLGGIDLIVPTDCIATAEFGCGWHWPGYIASVPYNQDVVRFRIVVDGLPVSESGLISRGRYKDAVQLVGCAIITAGRHRVWAEVQTGRCVRQDASMSLYTANMAADVIVVRARELVVELGLR